MVVTSWEQVDVELERVEDALKRLEVAIPERTLNTPRTLPAVRIAGMIESVHATMDLVAEWVERAKRM